MPEKIELPKDIVKLMYDQRKLQQNLPQNQRLYIGGKIILYYLTHDGIFVKTIHKFDDFDNTEKQILKNYNKNKF